MFIKDCFETVVLATNYPDYISARRSKHFIHYIDMYLFHQTWARSEGEIMFKLMNWGHVKDFDTQSYFNLWKSIDENNFQYIRNFHPLEPALWTSLEYGKGSNINEFIENYKKEHSLQLSKTKFLKKKYAQYRHKIFKK